MDLERDTHSGWRIVRPLPWFAVVIPLTYVLNLWLETGVSVLAAIRSVLIVVVAAGAATSILSLLTRRPQASGVAVLLAFALLSSRGLMYAVGIGVIAVAAGLALVLWARIRSEPPTWRRAGVALNVVSGILLVVVLAGGITGGSYAAVPADLRQGPSSFTPSASRDLPSSEAPDIVVLLLDGYPRSDWLERLFASSNGAFLEGLRDRGFQVADRSTSNYMFTELTLTSMLNMRAIPDIAGMQELIAGQVTDRTRMRGALNDNPVFDFLRERGYSIVTASPGYEHVALRRADVFLDSGNLNDFEYHLVRSTALQWLINRVAPGFFGGQQRGRIHAAFDTVPTVLAGGDGPTFAFIHVPAPHPPIVFDAQGGDAPPPPSGDVFQEYDTVDELNADGYVAQLQFLSDETLAALDTGLDARAGRDAPVVIVMSDHGAAPRPEVFEGDGGPEHYANLFAALTPGHEALFPDDISPVNVFPILLNAYFDADLPLRPDGVYPWAE